MRKGLVVALALACRSMCTAGEGPMLREAFMDLRRINVRSRDAFGDTLTEPYGLSMFTMAFDQPVFFNSSFTFTQLADDTALYAGATALFDGATELRCDGKKASFAATVTQDKCELYPYILKDAAHLYPLPPAVAGLMPAIGYTRLPEPNEVMVLLVSQVGDDASNRSLPVNCSFTVTDPSKQPIAAKSGEAFAGMDYFKLRKRDADSADILRTVRHMTTGAKGFSRSTQRCFNNRMTVAPLPHSHLRFTVPKQLGEQLEVNKYDKFIQNRLANPETRLAQSDLEGDIGMSAEEALEVRERICRRHLAKELQSGISESMNEKLSTHFFSSIPRALIRALKTPLGDALSFILVLLFLCLILNDLTRKMQMYQSKMLPMAMDMMFPHIVCGYLAQALTQSMSVSMSEIMYIMFVRALDVSLMSAITMTMAITVGPMLHHKIIHQVIGGIIRDVTKALSLKMIQIVTHSVTHMVTHSIIHHYYCIYCYFHGDYCNYCYYYNDYQWIHNLWEAQTKEGFRTQACSYNKQTPETHSAAAAAPQLPNPV